MRVLFETSKINDMLPVAQVMDGLDTQLNRIADYGDEQRDIEARLEVTAKTNAEVRQQSTISSVDRIRPVRNS